MYIHRHIKRVTDVIKYTYRMPLHKPSGKTLTVLCKVTIMANKCVLYWELSFQSVGGELTLLLKVPNWTKTGRCHLQVEKRLLENI